MKVYTIGHSTRSLEDFISLLKHFEVTELVDVRSIPRSRHTPQFNYDSLPDDLAQHNIKYVHMDKLGGRRSTNKSFINLGWRNLSFRGYADYMQTDDFKQGLDDLVQHASENQVAIMCAEAVPWRCHRSMVGDALLVRGYEVEDIFDLKTVKSQKLTSFARVEGNQITYPTE